MLAERRYNPPPIRGELRKHEPMANHTSWRAGGHAARWFKPADRDDLVHFLHALPPDEPVYFVGLGSNLLVRDGGLAGTVIATHGALGHLEHDGRGRVRAEAGVACAQLARQCVRWQLAGGDFFAGIPGTVGGALAMNAGAFGGEVWERVEAVETVDRAGIVRTRKADEFKVGYRTVHVPAEEWFLAGRFRFTPDLAMSREQIAMMLARRKAAQPITAASCGSVFRNPPGDHAARLIEAAGLKGRRVGGAVVSDKHANFILNDGNASAADIETLLLAVKAEVKARFGIELMPEVRIVGEPA
ncbi:MAG TPA: UDP-N-acetylmuramate dehydrogenase [Gammaproteobacteria bacterium]|nr:UDP-N-acetylmuramate dehydrogenase [Gammaproteobacteria bacterium]